MKHPFQAFFAVLFSLCLSPSLYAYSNEDLQAAYRYLDQIRTQAGMSLLQQNTALETAATDHAVYLITHGLGGHYQDQTQSPQGFTGVAPFDRATAAGYSAYSVGENVSTQISSGGGVMSIQSSIDDLLAAIYHRFGFLHLYFDEVGVGLAQGPYANNSTSTHSALVYDMGSQSVNQASLIQNTNPAIIQWPAADGQNIPPAFYTENPYPLSAIGYVDGAVSGYPISIQFNDMQYTSSEMTRFQLFRAADNQAISNTHLLTQANDPNNKLSALQYALFPLEHLEWGTTYRVQADYITNKDSGTLDWQFTTQCLGIPILYSNSTGETLNIPSGHQTFAVFFNSPETLAKKFRFFNSTFSNIQIKQEDDNTLIFTTESIAGNATIDIELTGGSSLYSFKLVTSDTASLPAETCSVGTPTSTPDTPAPTSSIRLTNISTRANISGGDNDAFAGFVIDGTGTQSVLMRGIAGVDKAGVDPKISLLKFNGSQFETVTENDEWEADTNATALSQLASNLQLPDRNGNDAGLLRDLSAGVYTAQLSSQGTGGATNISVDALNDSLPQLINISTRAHVSGGENDAFAGFVIQGTGSLKVMLRGVAAVAGSGVDPTLTLLKLNNGVFETIASNDEWEQDSQAAQVSQLSSALQLKDRNGNDAGLLRDLEAGVYTLVLGSKDAPGLAVVSVDAIY